MKNEELVILIKAGVAVADNMLKLWQQNTGMIKKIARCYSGMADQEDLEQECYIGLTKAVDHYNPAAGTLFFTYAFSWIQSEALRYARRNSLVHFPEARQIDSWKFRRYVSSFQCEHGREPTDREACRDLVIDKDQLILLQNSANMGQITSLDAALSDEDDTTIGDMLPCPDNTECVLEEMQQAALFAVLWPMVDTLPGRQPEIIRSRYLLNRKRTEVAAALELPYSHIAQQEEKAMRQLRKSSNVRKLEPFLDGMIYSRALSGNGVGSFNRTWTSSTERVAMKL